jgi:hypothetical protein
MKIFFNAVIVATLSITSFTLAAQTGKKDTATKHLFIDVHRLEPGKVKYEDVAKAHAKDLATETKYGVHFLKYWVDEDKGLVYCLSSASDTSAIRKTHAEAHGLLPAYTYMVTDGKEAPALGKGNDYFLDVHQLGAGNVTAKDVAGAHQKDLAVEGKHGVNLINYWVDEKAGVVMCLSQAKDSTSIIETHREAHGLLPAYVLKVKQGE